MGDCCLRHASARLEWVATHTAGPGQTNTGIDYSHGDYPVAA